MFVITYLLAAMAYQITDPLSLPLPGFPLNVLAIVAIVGAVVMLGELGLRAFATLFGYLNVSSRSTVTAAGPLDLVSPILSQGRGR